MANYYEHARSNYFEVKDEAAFLAWAEKRWIKTARQGDSPKFAVFPRDENGWPRFDFEVEDEAGYDADIDFVQELANRLKEGQIAVLQSVGYEKLRYLSGQAVAFDHTGKQVEVSIDDIYERAAAAFQISADQIEACEY